MVRGLFFAFPPPTQHEQYTHAEHASITNTMGPPAHSISRDFQLMSHAISLSPVHRLLVVARGGFSPCAPGEDKPVTRCHPPSSDPVVQWYSRAGARQILPARTLPRAVTAVRPARGLRVENRSDDDLTVVLFVRCCVTSRVIAGCYVYATSTSYYRMMMLMTAPFHL